MTAHLKSKRKRDVNLAKLDEPLMITLTNLPANRAGFRTVRSADALAQEDTAMLDLQRRTRTRSGKGKAAPKATPKVKISRVDAGLLTLVLPEGATEDDAATVIEQFGLGEDYTIRSEDGFISLVRKTEEGETLPGGVEVALAQGLTATVDYAMFPDAVARADAKEEGKADSLVVARMDFNIAYFETLEAVSDYLKTNAIDYMEDGVEQVEGGVIVHRVDPKDYDGKGKQIEIAPGVLAHVTRGETDSIPVAIRRAVTDAAFGSFGMGHLDFSAALVDPEFSSQAGNAIFQLSDVLDNIVFRSGLPLDERKDLINRATADFSGFMGGLMDAVGDMGFSNADRSDKPVDRTTEDATPAPDADADATARADEDKVKGKVTEAPAEDASTDSGTAAEAAARTDTDAGGEAKDTAAEGGDGEGGDAPAAAAPAVGVSRKDMEDVVKVALEAAGATFGDALKEIVKGNELTTKRLDTALKSLRTEVEKIGDTTNVARDDRTDDEVEGTEVGGDHGDSPDDSADVFRGAFGANFPRTRRAV
jgi:hypothetical protein